MDRREAIRLFIKRNSAMFRVDPFPAEVFKRLKQEFFLKFARERSVPKDSDIAAEILEGMINSAQIGNESDLESILALPFFRDKVSNKTYYRERLRLKLEKNEPLVDVSKIKEAEYGEKLKEEFKKQAREEVIQEKKEELQELDQEIAERTEQYFSVPSILDEEDYMVPEIPENGESSDLDIPYVPWWNKLGLREDPFHRLEGLEEIDRALYDQVVCKTEIFNKYVTLIEKNPKDLFRNIVVFGQFGSGKTTFFEYVEPLLYDCRIYPIYIQLGGEFEVRELVFEFRRQLNTELIRLYSVLTGRGLPSLDASDDEKAIAQLLIALADQKIERFAKGFVVFIDDLHKGDLEKAMRFMSHLQVLGSKLRRESKLNIAFFVAGSLEWEKKMTNDPLFSGSVHALERIPPLKMDIAHDAINRRLRAFAKNPDNPRQLERRFIEKIYKGLQYNGQEITFRRIMREVINEFEANHFDALSANPVKIPVSTLEEIKSVLEKDDAARRQINKLLYGAKGLKPAQKRRCFEVLVSIYERKSLPDSEIREQEAPFLQQLARAGLIRKVDEGRLVWRISKELLHVNGQIIRRYNLSLEDYLPRLYFVESQAEKRKLKLRSEEIQSLDAMLSKMKHDLVREHLESARNLHCEIIESGYKYLDSEEEANALVERCKTSLAKLTTTYQAYEKIPRSIGGSDLQILSFWKDFWWSPEVIQQFTRAVALEYEDKRRLVAQVVSIYREAFPLVFNFFKEEYEKSQQLHIPLVGLKNDEIRLLHECRDLWRENRYDEVAGRLTRVTERKLRTFLYNVFTILYGSFENRMRFLDADSRKYIAKNIEQETSKGFSVSRNEFQQLNRGQYRNLMTGMHGSPEGRHNWNCLFTSIFKGSEQELDSYLATFADFNIRVAHMKEDSIGAPEQDYVYSFLQKSMRFMMDMNNAYLRLLKPDCFRFASPSDSLFSFGNFKDRETLTPIELTKMEVERFIEAFEGKDQLKFPLDDQEYMEGIVGLEYRKIYALLALLMAGTEDQVKATKLNLRVLSTQGCELKVRLAKTTGWFSYSQEHSQQ
ncbi:MAG: ATP-binding protein [Candidatus Bathyarchaeia archaeon]